MSDSENDLNLAGLVRRLWPQVWSERRLFLPGAVLVILSIGTTLAYPQVIRIIVDEGIQGGDLSIVTTLAGLMAGIVVVDAAATWLFSYCFHYGARRIVASLRRRMHESLLSQELAFFDRESSGELIARLMSDVYQIYLLLAVRLSDALRFSVILVAGVGLVIYTSPLLAAVVAGVWPVIAYGTSKLGDVSRRAGRGMQDSESKVSRTALEAYAGIRTVRAFGQEAAERDRFQRVTSAHLAKARRGVMAVGYVEGFTKLASEAALVIGIFVGGRLIVQGQLSAGALVSFILYAGLVVRSTRNLSSFAAELARNAGTSHRVFRYIDRPTRMPIDGGRRPDRVEGRLDFEHVRFRYDDGEPGLAEAGFEANLRIERGEEVAVVGPSGSGKSTLLSLAARLYDVEGGRVLFDGVDVRELDPLWLREQVAYVSQDSSLFSRTISENVRYGRADADDAQVLRALRAAGAAAFVEALPEGLATEVGDRGSRLSGGQRQRLALARALLREPAVLILDEATSALDAESEAQVKEALRKLPHKPTVIWIAHRLSTVVDVGRVLVVESGRVVADGSHAELLASSPFYRELIETQLVRE